MSESILEVMEPEKIAIAPSTNGAQGSAQPTRRRLPDHRDLPISADEYKILDPKWAASNPKAVQGVDYIVLDPKLMERAPTHLDLPDEDPDEMKNVMEHPQSMLITETIWPVLERLHPDGQFAVGQDSAIYWRLTDPYRYGAVSPDWYYVPGVPPMLDGGVRRSYVLWVETVKPVIVIEFISHMGGGEYDRTPNEGKFWIYENIVQPAYYAIYTPQPARLDVFRLRETGFQEMTPNPQGRFPIPPLGVELGLWPGVYRNMDLDWVRCWDAAGILLPTGEERAAMEAERAQRLAARLRALGIDPDELEDA